MAIVKSPAPGFITRFAGFLLGSRLPSSRQVAERLSNLAALGVLAANPLSSVAYATEEMLRVKGPVIALLTWSMPIALAIVGLLAILTFSYRQTIHAYPQGGGAYNVARENLGLRAGLAAASGLLIDYVLTVAVSIAAGVAALTSAFSGLRPYKVELALFAIVVLTLINLRGVRSTGRLSTVPTLAFIAIMLALLITGVVRYMVLGTPVPEAPEAADALAGVGLFLLLRAFAAGCTALLGIEAIANAVGVFKPPEPKNAARTMLWMAVILAGLFIGITYFARRLGVVPAADQTVVSQIARLVFAGGPVYYLVQIATVGVLGLAANTAFSTFPRVTYLLGRDRYLPQQLSDTGRRLVFSNGIMLLAVLSFGVVVAVDVNVHALIPLYAVGVFMSFTLSQAGMVVHWRRVREPGWRRGALINGTGAVVTCAALIVIIVAKGIGAWAVILFVSFTLWLFYAIHRHYLMVAKDLSLEGFTTPSPPPKHTVIIPISGVHRAALNAVAYAKALSTDVRAVHVCADESEGEALRAKWRQYVPDVPMEVIHSPFRNIVGPFLRYVDSVRRADQQQLITVVIPEFVTRHWWEIFLHHQMAWVFRVALMFRRSIAVTSVPHHLQPEGQR